MGNEMEWPLPSESRRVRRFLYVSEGLILGAGILLITVGILGESLIDLRTGSFNPHITAFGIFGILLMIYYGGRYGAIKRVASQENEKPVEYQDWSATRKWRWVTAVALLVIGVLLGGALLVWEWSEIVLSRSFDLLLFGAILAGVLFYIYVLHRLGV